MFPGRFFLWRRGAWVGRAIGEKREGLHVDVHGAESIADGVTAGGRPWVGCDGGQFGVAHEKADPHS